MRLDNHRTFRVFYGSIGQTGMQQAAFGDANLFLRQIFKTYGSSPARTLIRDELPEKLTVSHIEHLSIRCLL